MNYPNKTGAFAKINKLKMKPNAELSSQNTLIRRNNQLILEFNR